MVGTVGAAYDMQGPPVEPFSFVIPTLTAVLVAQPGKSSAQLHAIRPVFVLTQIEKPSVGVLGFGVATEVVLVARGAFQKPERLLVAASGSHLPDPDALE